MKQTSILVFALVVVSAGAVERKRVLRAPIHSPADSNIDEFKSMFDAEGAAAEAMEAFGRFLQSSASGASLPPPITEPPTVVPKADATTTVPTTTVPTATPVTAKPTEVPTPAPEATDAPTESSANVAPLTEPDGGTNDPNDVVVETTASGGGVAIPLLSVLGVVGIASLVVARRSYLANANSDADSASSDSQESSQS